MPSDLFATNITQLDQCCCRLLNVLLLAVLQNKDLPIENTTDCLSTMASICRVMIENPYVTYIVVFNTVSASLLEIHDCVI